MDDSNAIKGSLAVIALVLLAGLSGCLAGGDQGSAQGEAEQSAQGNVDDEVDRFVDEEAGVVCYKYHGFEKGGLSCVPIEETNLLYEGGS